VCRSISRFCSAVFYCRWIRARSGHRTQREREKCVCECVAPSAYRHISALQEKLTAARACCVRGKGKKREARRARRQAIPSVPLAEDKVIVLVPRLMMASWGNEEKMSEQWITNNPMWRHFVSFLEQFPFFLLLAPTVGRQLSCVGWKYYLAQTIFYEARSYLQQRRNGSRLLECCCYLSN
jgi:hypothetical protein